MMGRPLRAIALVVLMLMLAAPAFGSSGGPPMTESGGNPTATYGCTCHGDGVPSTGVLISIAGVPEAYALDVAYPLNITIAAAGMHGAGFYLSSSGVGTFSWEDGAGIRPVEGSSEPADALTTSADVTQDAQLEGSESVMWSLTWTAPSADAGDLAFSLVGNAVDGSGSNDAADQWNILSFTISAPGTGAQSGEGLAARVISVGDYESLFAAEDTDPAKAEIEAERAEEIFSLGTAFYVATLIMLIVGGVVVREVDDRRLGRRVPWLAKDLAAPQFVRRGVLAAVLLGCGIAGLFLDWATGYEVVLFFVGVWASYGVYRTWLQVQQEPLVGDIV